LSQRPRKESPDQEAPKPDHDQKTTLFYGWYSNRTRGYRMQHGLLGEAGRVEPTPEVDARARLEVLRSWGRLIRGVYELDPLLCPRCGGTMRVIAVIEQPAVIRQIRSAELATKPRSPGHIEVCCFPSVLVGSSGESAPGGLAQFLAARLQADRAEGNASDLSGILERGESLKSLSLWIEVLKDAQRQTRAVLIVQSQ
jgi:hypothetical protein